MEKSKVQSLIKRTISAAVMMPLVILALWYGFPYMNILVMLIGVLLAWEWSTMVPSVQPTVYAAAYAGVAGASALLPPGFIWGAIVLIALAFVFFASRKENHRRLLMLGVLYISMGVGSIGWLYAILDFAGTMWLFLAVWSVDVGGYLVGSTLKGPKLAPRISPNKTWSGLVGGVLLSVLVCGGFVYWMGGKDFMLFFCAMAAAVAVVSQLGDLIESAMKRHLGVKDSSNLIPGHGGVFDRVDGLIFAAPMLFLTLQIVNLLSR